MAESKFITVEDFNKYSKYLSEEIKSIKEGMSSLTEAESNNSQLETLKEYTDYLAKKLDEAIAYSEHVAEKADKGIQYVESLAETLDNSIQYSEHIAESVDTIKNYTNYLAESYNEGVTSHDNLIKYTEYLRENLEKVTEYAEYVAETVNTNLLLEDGEAAGLPAEEIKDETTDVTVDTIDADDNVIDTEVKDIEKELELNGEGEAAGEEIKEGEAGLPAEDIEAETKDITIDTVDADGNVITGEVENTEAKLDLEGEGEAAGKDVDAMEAYKNSITSKLEALVEKVNAKKNEGPAFFKFISEEKVNEFNSLNQEEKTKIVNAIEGKGYLTEGQILGLWANSLMGAVQTPSTLPVISMMPAEYHSTWTKLSEGKKHQIMAQAKMVKLETAYQVANFWQTRDLRESAPVMEKLTMINESAPVEVKTIGYDTTGIAEQIAARFKK
jgi:uncharacterized protein YoxC